jgi:hypothetical protein
MLVSLTHFLYTRFMDSAQYDTSSYEGQSVVLLSRGKNSTRCPDALVLELVTKNSYCFPKLLNFFVPKAPSQATTFLISQPCRL